MMYVNSPGNEKVSLSLTFMGKKVSRHHTGAPAGKERAWEKTRHSGSIEDSTVSSQVWPGPAAASVLDDIPGSVPDLREEALLQHKCPVHSTHLDQEQEEPAAVVQHKTLWQKKWDVFRRWIWDDHKKHPRNESDQGPSTSQLSDNSEMQQEVQRSKGVKIYIPYASAELCVTQIAGDVERMKIRHREMVKGLEENFQMAARENQAIQEQTAQAIRSHYQNKMNALKRILDLYQEKVERKNTEWEKRVMALTMQNEQLLEDQKAERKRSEEESQHWHREKSKILELFSHKMDLLHSHQASTLQELQMAKHEVGKVQQLLQSTQEAKKDADTSEDKLSAAHQPANCSNSDLPLEGDKARLEDLKESLYQREREFTELLEAKRSPIPPVPPTPCNILLPTVIQKAHAIASATAESRTLLDQMTKQNRVALIETRDKLDCLQMSMDNYREEKKTDQHRPDGYGSRLSFLQDTVRDFEISQMALDCIRTGECPATSDCDGVSELEDILGRGTIQTSGGIKSVGQQLLLLQDQLKHMKEENKKIIENYTSERILRKRYYNMVEDMKGKIRVFCRIRPLSRAEATQGGVVVVETLDEYTVSVETLRGPREFQFDQVFRAESSQEELFKDINRLIQSTVDGYNVCIFAYGQTGSGKTFTMIGDKDQRNLGIMPRAFTAIFDLIQQNSTKFEFKVSAYMLELYNDRLQDLFVSVAGEAHAQVQAHQPRRVEIKRNRKGVVFAQGAETKEASSAQELFALFQQACANRHISATRMNVESSRSHLIVGIMVESRNLTNGSVSCGKLSLVDLAGSERAAKTGARNHQLKEANSINKSLSALGDVISALSAELPHVPYRNSQLTQVMQDSLGGNAKTLMIVNISPSECNLDETLTSLIYAARVKTITNIAQRNQDSKEIAQLKDVIVRLRSGQPVEVDI